MEKELQKLVVENRLKWLPWIGGSYGNSEIRILVIGESHYYNPDEENSFEKHQAPVFTREVIEEMAMQREYYNTKVFQNFHRALLGNDSFDATKFWNNMAYYNFIQKPMNTNKGRPTNQDFTENWSGFIKLAEILKPTVCIFIGTSSANTFNGYFSQQNIEFIPVEYVEKIGANYAKKASIKINNKIVPIHFIKHTCQYFSWLNWNEYLNKTISQEIKFLESIVDN